MAWCNFSQIMRKAAFYRSVGETKSRALQLAWDDAITEYVKKHGDLPKSVIRKLCEEAKEEFYIPPEMTPEYWEKEKKEVTIYGIRDEYGGL